MKTIERIKTSLESISNELSGLLKEAPIKHLQRGGEGVVIIAPEYYWGELNPEQKGTQIRLKRRYDQISEIIYGLLENAPQEIARELEEADGRYRKWLEFDLNWSLEASPERNEAKFREDIAAVYNIIEVLSADKINEEIVIPDTNSLLSNQDPKKYQCVVNANGFTFLLLPTVLGELDELKMLHRNPDVREKAKKCIKRIKGWRNQGSLNKGVVVHSTIIVTALHKEPNMDNTLSWLDRNNRDDRIVASVLAAQADYPNSRVVLVTGDINLQNKADAAFIEVEEMKLAQQ